MRWREGAEPGGPGAGVALQPEAKYSAKRGEKWLGYKVHVTESCDEGCPRLIVGVVTTPPTWQGVSTTLSVHQALAGKHRLPGEHFVDAGYNT